MKNIFYILLTAFLLPCCLAFSLPELETQLQEPQNIQGKFNQQKYLRDLSQPIKSSGRFILIPQLGLLWVLEKPFEHKMRVLPTGIEQYSAEANKWISTPNQSAQNNQINLFLNLLTGDTRGLAQHFNLKLTGKADSWQLTLTPNTLIFKQIFSTIELHGDKVVKKIIINEKQGDKTLILFPAPKINQPVKAADKYALQK